MGNAGRVTDVSVRPDLDASKQAPSPMKGLTPMKGRFAPSPTGYMHLGNVWVALLSWLSVRLQGGRWVLRIEDIDTARSKPALAEELMNDLEWLGLTWDEGPRVGGPDGPYYQSERSDYYESIIGQWATAGAVYPCYCNRARLLQIASAPHEGEAPVYYDGHCRHLTEAERAEASSRKTPSLRRAVFEPAIVSWCDYWQGSQSQLIRPEADDFVVRRADGMYAYNLAVVADDAAMGITEIIRGYDLLDATGIQLWLYEQLGFPVPHYGHVPLLIDSEGARLSKRQHSITIRELREAGYTAADIIGRLASMAGLTAMTGGDGSHGVDAGFGAGRGGFEAFDAEALFHRLRDAGFVNLNNNDYLKDSHLKLTNFDIKV